MITEFLRRVLEHRYGMQRAFRVLNIRDIDQVSPQSRLIKCYIYPMQQTVPRHNRLVLAQIAPGAAAALEDLSAQATSTSEKDV